jgi:hypothetical protein
MSVQRSPESESFKRISVLLQHAHCLELDVFRQSTDLEHVVYGCADPHIVYIRSICLGQSLVASW